MKGERMGRMDRMKWIVYNKGKILTFLAAVLTCLIAFSFWFTMYYYDNKYTAQGPKALDGILELDDQSLKENPVVFLVDGWEYYSNILLTPEDFDGDFLIPDQYIFIGRFGGFEGDDKNSPPHGSASYRMHIVLPRETSVYGLELPEIFSAYRLYVNGSLAASMGNPEPESYYPQTGNRVISIEAADSIEILVAVSDYSHLYSGMVYPPAVGQQSAVHMLLNTRLFWRTALCIVVLTVGFLSLFVSLLSENTNTTKLYGLLCLMFVGYACYPITQTFFTGFQPKYAIENISFCAMLLIVMILAKDICQVKGMWSNGGFVFGGIMCLFAGAGPFLWSIGNLRIMMIYSFLISVYEWYAALFLTSVTAWGVWNDTICTKPLFFGILIFDTALVADRWLPLYEPIVTGWFVELAGFMLVVAIGIAIGQEVAARYRETVVLTEREKNMQHLYRRQQTYYGVLKREMEESKKMRHDMRHHFTMINALMQSGQYEKLSSYVSQYKSAVYWRELPEYCPIDVINVLSHHYAAFSQDNEIHMDIRCDLDVAGDKAEYVNMSDADLCCLYSNLMENAAEACLRIKDGQRNIRVAIVRPDSDTLMIRIWNSTDENVKAVRGSFLSSKGKEQHGYGLLSIHSIAEKYGGSARFNWDKDKGEFDSEIIMSV